MLGPNRVSRAIDVAREAVSKLNAVAASELDTTLALDFDEHFAYQQAQARAHAEGVLTTDEAQIVYVALGEVGSPSNGGWATGTDTATKAVVTQLIGQLLAGRLKAAR
jgi:hypothetical protein